MPIPEYMFYLESSSSSNYQAEPSGTVDIERLLSGHDRYWLSPIPLDQGKKKKIILADWTADHWSRAKLELVVTQLKELLDQDFEIHMSLNGELKPLNKNNLHLLYSQETRVQIAPCALSMMEHSLRVSRDKIHVLDGYGLSVLFDPDTAKEGRVLYGEDILNSKGHSRDLKPILAWITESNTPIKLFKNNWFTDTKIKRTLANLKELAPLLPDIPQIDYCTELHLRENDFFLDSSDSVFHQYTKTVRKLSIDNKFLKHDNFDYNKFIKFLQDCTQLESVDLSECTLNESQLFQLLQAIPNVRDIHIRRIKFTEDFLFPDDGFKKVQFIDLPYSTLSVGQLHQLLELLPELKELNLSGVPLTGISAWNKSLKIRVLNLSYSKISSTHLAELINNSPDLEELNIVSCHNIKTLSNDLKVTRTKLKVLAMNDYIGFEDKLKLLQIAPDLKKLEINLGGNPILSKELQDMLQLAPNLEELSLGVYCYADPLNLPSNSLRKLTKLHLYGTHATMLTPLLLASPNLQELDLPRSDKLKIELPKGSLNQLTKMNLDGSYIAEDHLIVLLLAAPNLITLKLNATKNIHCLTSLPKDSLIQLKTVNLEYSKLNGEGLISLLLAAPNLEFINLEYTSIEPEQIEAIKKHYPKLEINYSFLGDTPKPSNDWNARLSSLQRNTFEASVPGKKEVIDADTQDRNSSFHVNQVFYPVSNAPEYKVNFYRKSAYSELHIHAEQCPLEQAFELSNPTDLELNHCALPPTHVAIESKKEMHCYQGYASLSLSKTWQALPSLSSAEQLLSLNTIPASHSIELVYSKKTNLYYIRTTKPSNNNTLTSIEFTIGIKPSKPPKINPEITQLASQCRSFGSGALTLTKGTGAEYIKAMYEEKKGACRHRAVVFKAQMMERFPEVPVRIITNDCHAFVEVLVQGSWHTMDLGGYPAELTINESFKKQRAGLEEGLSLNAVHELDSLEQEVPYNKHPTLDQLALKQCATWSREQELISAKHYLQHCISGVDASGSGGSKSIKNRLIQFKSAKAQMGLRYALENYCHSTHRPVFYVHKPEDLICASPSIKAVNGRGIMERGPTGPLYQFLKNNPNGVLIVNYSSFSAEDLVRWNALLDAHRKVDNVDLPQDMAVIGLLNEESHLIPGSDFFSRFDATDSCPIEETELAKELHPTPQEAPTDSSQENTAFIDFHHGTDWKTQLLGGFVAKEGQWHYEDGVLHQALNKAGTTGSLCIRNGLWENPDFCHFWQDLQQKGFVHTPTGVIDYPKSLRLTRSEGYDWDKLKDHIQCVTVPPSGEYTVLNPGTIHQIFGQYSVQGHYLEKGTGAIAHARLQSPSILRVYVTHTLNEDTWASILDEADKAQVTIQAYCAPGVNLPEAMSDLYQKQEEQPLAALTDWPEYGVIRSTDVDVTLAKVGQNNEYLIIPCADLSPSDLLNRIDVKMSAVEQEDLRLEFNEQVMALQKALDEGRKVVLHGPMSQALSYALAPLFLNKTPGLYYLGQETSLHHYLPKSHWKHEVTPAERSALLQQESPRVLSALQPLIEQNESLARLQARAQALERYPESLQGDEAWMGLHSISPKSLDPGAFDAQLDNQHAVSQWVNARKSAIETIWTSSPYVFLSGLSGVGKSTFVTKELLDKEESLHLGEDRLLEWAQDASPGRKILFIDEANLSNESWSQFEGLWQNPPKLLIGDRFYELSAEHKVVFAGNPLSYGDERKLPDLFARHGNALLFDVIPSPVLYERILKPVFQGSDLKEQAGPLSQSFLEIYRFLCQCSEKDVLISPRELEMMALCTVAYCKQHQDADPMHVAQHMAFGLSVSLVPEHLKNSFIEQFKPHTALPVAAQLDTDEYFGTPSRATAIEWMNHFLAVREERSSLSSNGGLGGLILEGEPGIGKSELVTSLLVHHGYHELHDHEAPVTDEKGFYRMPVSMSLPQKEALLRKAFHEGMVVVIDEINSSPMMERLLNALLMGSTPEGEKPKKPGFMIIGTQNPAHMAGRRLSSTALMRRTLGLTLSPYSKEEMQDILMKKGLEPVVAERLVWAYEKQRQHALSNNLSPIPTFRDLLRNANYFNHQGKSVIAEAQHTDNAAVELTNKKAADIAQDLKTAYANFAKKINQLPSSEQYQPMKQSFKKIEQAYQNFDQHHTAQYLKTLQFQLNRFSKLQHQNIDTHRGFGSLPSALRKLIGVVVTALSVGICVPVVSKHSSNGYKQTFFGQGKTKTRQVKEDLEQQIKKGL